MEQVDRASPGFLSIYSFSLHNIHFGENKRNIFCRFWIIIRFSTFFIPSMMMGAKYEEYLLGTSFARPVIAKSLVEIALNEGADAICHGCTGKGNDQVRFELAIKRFAPEMTIIAPWRSGTSRAVTRRSTTPRPTTSPLKISRETNYSKDKNLWHLSHEGLDLEDPGQRASVRQARLPGDGRVPTMPPTRPPMLRWTLKRAGTWPSTARR